MAKKEDLKNGLSNVLNNESANVQTRQPFGGNPGRPQRGDTRTRAHENACYTSLYLEKEPYEKLREIARRNGLSNKELLSAAIKKYIELYEAKNGPVEIPRESKISAESLI